MPEPERRRRRPAVSCTLCRQRKIRCNKELPCNNCLRSKSGNCVYDNPPHPKHSSQASVPRDGQRPVAVPYATPQHSDTTAQSTVSRPTARNPATSSSVTSPAVFGQNAEREVEALRSRVRELESKLATSSSVTNDTAVQPTTTIETLQSSIGGAFHVEHDSSLFGETQFGNRSLVHKGRIFGQSHWINGVFLMFKDVAGLLEPYVRDESCKAVYIIGKCKAISRIIKEKRTPTWPAPPTPDLPPKEVADELVDNYLRTFETVYRVLHVPAFKTEYEALWLSGATPDPMFLVKVKLVLALGAITYDDKFTLRAGATRWVYEAITWASDPDFKRRLHLDYLQIQILMLIAREMVINNIVAHWISAGSLLRTAMLMGLHRDPARFPHQTTYVTEMRRRIWNTILELNLQASMASGSPVLVSPQDFDTQAPQNLDDDQLLTENPIPKPVSEFTSVTVARALRQTFHLRLAVIHYLNDMCTKTSYEEVLRLDKELRVASKAMRKTLSSLSRSSAAVNSSPPFALQIVDLIIHRCISALHIPSFERALCDANYAYSRKVAFDSSIKIWYIIHPSSALISSSSASTSNDSTTDLQRLVTSGHGFFRNLASQSMMMVALELRSHLHENDGLGPAPLRTDLLTILADGLRWIEACIVAGETNPKGYLLQKLMTTQLECLRNGVERDDMPEILLATAEEAGEKALGLLEGVLAEMNGGEGLEEIGWEMPAGLMSDVDFFITDNGFMGADDQMNWGFGPDSTLWQ